ncbi:MAG: efflux RND transporter permease subunit [Acidobacteria bacterium]|nr:MAG: efflux RND transporter permease subunit [Acidobacteriota bacterium]
MNDKEHINPIVKFAVERRVTMTMAVLGIFVLGYLSLTRLPLEFMPSFSSNSIWVSAPYSSSSPEEVERLIVRPLEDILGTINGIDTLSATASATEGSVNITFKDNVDMDLAAVDVRDRIDRVRHLLPDDLRRIRIRRFQSTDIPVFRFHLSAEWDKDRFYEFTEQVVQRRLERLEGVASVEVRGIRKRELQVQLRPSRLQAAGLDARDITSVLRNNHVNLSGGYIKEGPRKLIVRSVGEFRTVEEIEKLLIGTSGVRIQDVADVSYTYPRQDNFNYLNDNEAVTLSVFKASTANLLAVVDGAKAELEIIKAMPSAEGLETRILMDSSVDVRQGLGQLRNAGLLGGGLAVVFLFLFLRKVRTTALVAISIPISIILTFVILYFLRQLGLVTTTINVVSLMGLMLAVGMLVDNSVVVIESISRHFTDLDEDPRTAALRGTTAVAMPIIASTLTTMCVFIPMIFLAATGGGFMRFMLDIGITICIVMVSSLLVALTVVPMVASVLLDGETKKETKLTEVLETGYGWVIGFTLRHRFVFCLAIVGMLYGSYVLLGTIERTFSPRTMARQISINVDTPRSYSLEQTRELYAEVAKILNEKQEELDISDVVYRYSRTGGRSRGGFRGSRKIDIYLVDEAEAKRPVREIRDAIRDVLPTKAGVDFKIAQSTGHGGHGGGSFGVNLDLKGDDMAVLELVAERVVSALEDTSWARDVDSTLDSGTDEIHVSVDRERALASGLSTQAVAFSISSALSSRPISRISADDREVDLVVQFREQDRSTLDQLKKMPIMSSAAVLSIGAMADFEIQQGPRRIEREDKRPKLSITANTNTAGASFRMQGQVSEIMNSISLPPGYEWGFGRSWGRAQQDWGNALFAFIFALGLIYLIMAALFESFVQPFTIMFAIPFAFIGVGIVLKLTSQPLDNMANMGLIILVGVVVNNAIVLIAHINHLRLQGVPRDEAIVVGGTHRLRPILMTALTTILGLFPMVAPLIFPGFLGTAEGRAGNWAPVGLVILAGLTTSTFLTLVIIPTIYSLVDDSTRFFGKIVRAA